MVKRKLIVLMSALCMLVSVFSIAEEPANWTLDEVLAAVESNTLPSMEYPSGQIAMGVYALVSKNEPEFVGLQAVTKPCRPMYCTFHVSQYNPAIKMCKISFAPFIIEGFQIQGQGDTYIDAYWDLMKQLANFYKFYDILGPFWGDNEAIAYAVLKYNTIENPNRPKF